MKLKKLNICQAASGEIESELLFTEPGSGSDALAAKQKQYF